MFKVKFTLIELLVVITILAILMAMLMPALVRAKYTAKSLVCISQLKQFMAGALTYGIDNNRKLPPRDNGPGTATNQMGYPHEMYRGYNLHTGYIQPYITRNQNDKLLYCPLGAFGTGLIKWSSYAYYVWPNGFYWQIPQPNYTRYSTITKPDRAPIWGDNLITKPSQGLRSSNHKLSGANSPNVGMNATFADGSAKWVKVADTEVHWYYGGQDHQQWWPKYRND